MDLSNPCHEKNTHNYLPCRQSRLCKPEILNLFVFRTKLHLGSFCLLSYANERKNYENFMVIFSSVVL